MKKELLNTQNWSNKDVEILQKNYDIVTTEDIIQLYKNNDLVFTANPKDYLQAYREHCNFESTFDPKFRDKISYHDFVKELKKGYGKSACLQIARLVELSTGISYDNNFIY